MSVILLDRTGAHSNDLGKAPRPSPPMWVEKGEKIFETVLDPLHKAEFTSTAIACYSR